MQNTSRFFWLFSVTLLVALCVGHAWELNPPEEVGWFIELNHAFGVNESLHALGMTFGLMISTAIYLVGAFGLYLWGMVAKRRMPTIFSDLIAISAIAILAVGALLYLP